MGAKGLTLNCSLAQQRNKDPQDVLCSILLAQGMALQRNEKPSRRSPGHTVQSELWFYILSQVSRSF